MSGNDHGSSGDVVTSQLRLRPPRPRLRFPPLLPVSDAATSQPRWWLRSLVVVAVAVSPLFPMDGVAVAVRNLLLFLSHHSPIIINIIIVFTVVSVPVFVGLLLFVLVFCLLPPVANVVLLSSSSSSIISVVRSFCTCLAVIVSVDTLC